MSTPEARVLAAAALAAAVGWERTRQVEPLDIERWAQRTFADEPFEKLAAMVGLGALLFYGAERGRNPKVQSLWDALVYVSTCASVGYGDIFAQTPIGKAVGTFVMTVGPAMANSAFVGHAHAREREHAVSEATQREILSALQAILGELRKADEKAEEPGRP